MAEIVLGRIAICGRGRESVSGLAQVLIAQDDGDTGRTDRERGDRVFDRFARERRIGVEQLDRIFHQFAATLGADDNAGTNLAQFNHVGDLNDAIQQAKAGVRDVVNHRFIR